MSDYRYKTAFKLVRKLIRNEGELNDTDIRILRSLPADILGKALISLAVKELECDLKRIKYDCQIQQAGSFEAYHDKQTKDYIKRNLSRRDKIPF